MKILQVVSRIDKQASGLATTVPALSQAVSALGHEVGVHGLAVDSISGNVRVQRYRTWPFLTKLGISPELKRSLRGSTGRIDVIHSHSLWTMPNMYPGEIKERKGTKVVMSPRGTLDPAALRISRWRKRTVWWMRQRRALSGADLLHATSESEVEAIRRAGLRQPIALIPNGVDIPVLSESVNREHVILYLGRLHAQKRVEDLIEAWSQVEADNPAWRLRIVGPENQRGYVNSLRTLVRERALKKVTFAPPAYREDRLREYRQAAILVLPTATENFGMVVAEALAAGTPVIVTKGAPWAGVVEHGCGWWEDHGAGAIRGALLEAMTANLTGLHQMGARGRKWMERDYQWGGIADQMVSVYRWIRAESERPSWILTR